MCNLLLWQEIHNSKMNTRQELYNSAVRLSEHFSPKSCRLLLLAIIFGICAIAITGKSVSAETSPRIQLLDGFLGDEQGIVYTLADLKKGDTVYANMKGISGNLDPMLGMFRKDSHPDFQYDDVSEFIANSDVNLVDAFSQFASDKFIVWDDDGGQGYAARLKFSVPADGDYRILAGSMITYLSFGSLTPTFTTGTYRLSLGLNTPDVETGKGEPTGELIAIVEKRTTKSSSHVQNYEQKFTVDKQFAVHQLRNLKPGDTLYVRVVSPKDHPPLRLLLTDFGGKPLVFGKADEQSNGVMFSYETKNGASGLYISLDGRNSGNLSEEVKYRVITGINAPEVLHADTIDRGLPVFQDTRNVKVGLSIDQIVNVDQQRENFTVVGSLQMIWQDPALAFSQDKCNCAMKMMDVNGLKALAIKNDILLPLFTFFNQQGKRWSEIQSVFIEPSGDTIFLERFTVTLQAPDFDFRVYPFDNQKFIVRLDLNVPTDVFTFEGIENPGEILGDQLGEEEWSVINYSQDIKEVSYGKDLTHTRFSTTLEMKRHLNFYMFRILLPLFLIISVSWVIFFLKDYGKQLEVASGNLLVFVAFNFTISDDLPRLGYLTLLDRIIITSFCCAALVVFISVCQKRLEAKDKIELASYIDKVVLISYPLVYVSFIAVEYFMVNSRIGI